jgi:hypothetical protein
MELVLSLWEHLGGKAEKAETDRIKLDRFRQCVDARLRKQFKKLTEVYQALPKWAQKTPAEKAADSSIKFISRLRDRLGRFLFGQRSSFSLDDVLRVAWPQASSAELKRMKAWFMEISQDPRRRRVRTPPLLDPDEYKELCAVFRHFDVEGNNSLSFEGMVGLGLIDREQVEETRREWDGDGNGLIDMHEFCEMMCPLGYRASRTSMVATLEDGRRVVREEGGHWQMEH